MFRDPFTPCVDCGKDFFSCGCYSLCIDCENPEATHLLSNGLCRYCKEA